MNNKRQKSKIDDSQIWKNRQQKLKLEKHGHWEIVFDRTSDSRLELDYILPPIVLKFVLASQQNLKIWVDGQTRF